MGIFKHCLVFIPVKKYIKCIIGTTRIYYLKSNGISEKIIDHITKLDINFSPPFVNHHLLSNINFNGHFSINNICISKKVINIKMFYILNPCLRNLNLDFTLYNCLLGSVKLTKYSDLDKHKYSDCSIGYDSRL